MPELRVLVMREVMRIVQREYTSIEVVSKRLAEACHDVQSTKFEFNERPVLLGC